MKINSLLVFFILVLIIATSHFVYYPKWRLPHTEATISWDVSGYYMYLPAMFIYNDVKKCSFKDEILTKYKPSPNFDQAFIHEKSGNYVMKYSIGQAIQYAPFFGVAHMWAQNSSMYPADGFSCPYQFMISFGSLLIAFLGLYYLRKNLLFYYSDAVVGLTLLGIVLGSNYLNYSAIDGAMTHNNLFTIYALLIYNAILFYKKTSYLRAAFIGLLIGLAALTRPTELLACLIPLLWGINLFESGAIKHRLAFLRKNYLKIFVAALCCVAVGAIQFVYWKYVSGEWIVYSYQDQGFSWLKPHIMDGIFSYKSGWLVYSPLMVFSLIGFYWLVKKHKSITLVVTVFTILFIYIAFAWDIWWYGGSLGQRTMIQAYPILAFPLSSFFAKYLKTGTVLKIALSLVFLAFCYLNFWFTHQAHKGGLLHVSQMTKEYYWKTLGTYKKEQEHLKLLDTDELYSGERKDVKKLENIDTDPIVLNKDKQNSRVIKLAVDNDFEWLRVYADFKIAQKEWDIWRMTQFILKFNNGNENVKTRMIRMQRHLNDQEEKSLYMDIQKPSAQIDTLEISFWNANGNKEITISDIRVETFNE